MGVAHIVDGPLNMRSSKNGFLFYLFNLFRKLAELSNSQEPLCVTYALFETLTYVSVI